MCSLFTVFTGASGVTIIALGGVLMPALVRQGYPKKFSMGLIAGTGSVGLLFPPALPLFIYGTIYGLSQLKDLENKPWDTKKFLAAGIIPGSVLIGMLCAVAIFVAVKNKLPRQKFEMGELGTSLIKALPEIFIPFGVILGLASGFGPPEIAALTVLYVVILELGIYRMISLRALWNLSGEMMAMIGAIFAIIFASTAFTDFLVQAEVPSKLVTWTNEHVDSKIVFLLAINLLLLIVGTVMDIFSAIVVVLPLIAPIARSYGIDPYHVGVIFLLNLEVGYLHPPVGLNLFLTSVKFQRPITEVMWATIPFLVTMIVALVVITYVPQLTSSSVKLGQAIGMSPMDHEPVKNLIKYTRDGVAESRVTVTEITFVDAGGTQLLVAGKPVVQSFGTCRKRQADIDAAAAKVAAAKGVEAVARSETEVDRAIDNCQKPFFALTDCKVKPEPERTTCSNKAIAKWIVETYNEDNPEDAVITVTEMTLADASGEPLTYEVEEIGPDGKPLVDKLENKITKSVAIVGPDKKPVTRTLKWCDTLDDFDREKCRALFIAGSGCKINYEADSDCLDDKCKPPEKDAEDKPADKPAGAGSGSGSAAPAGAGSGSAAPPPPVVDPAVCRKAAEAECSKESITECTVTATKEWIKDNVTVASNPKPKGSNKGGAAATEESGGCSTSGGSLGGVLFVGTVLLALRRRRRHAA
jgi:C4-dicarboxylate transporter, DctM subunit